MTKKHLAMWILLTFLLGSHKGYIALWEVGIKYPLEVFPYRVTSLPPEDQKALTEGIPIENQHDLTVLLEDYLS